MHAYAHRGASPLGSSPSPCMHTLTTAPPSSPQVRPWAQAAMSALPAETHADAAVFVEAAFSAEALREVADTVMLEARKPGRPKGRALPAGAKPAAGQPSPTHRLPMKSLLPPLPPLRARRMGAFPIIRYGRTTSPLLCAPPRHVMRPRHAKALRASQPSTYPIRLSTCPST